MTKQITAVLKPFYKGDPGVPTQVLERFGALSLITSTSGVAVGELAFVSESGASFERAADDALDAHLDYSGSGGVKLYEAGPNFSDRARLVAAHDRNVAASRTVPDGTVWTFNGLRIERDSTATDISDLPGWKPADEWVHSDVFNVPRDGTTDATSAIATFLTYGFTEGRKLRFQFGATYLIDGAGADSGGVTVELAAGYKDLIIDARGVTFQGGSGGTKLDNDMIRVNVASGATTGVDFHERPKLHWRGGLFDQSNSKNSTVVPNSGVGQLDTGSSATTTALNFRCNDSGEPAFSAGLFENLTFYCGEYWETAEAGDQQLSANGIGNVTVRNSNFQASRDLGVYWSGSDSNETGTVTVEDCFFWRCYGGAGAKYDTDNFTVRDCTFVDCVKGILSTLGSTTATGNKHFHASGNRFIRVETALETNGTTYAVGGNNQIIDAGYAYLTAWDNGVSTGAVGDRVTGVHPGGVSQATSLLIKATQHLDMGFTWDGVNAGITDGNANVRAITIFEGTVNSVTVQCQDIRIRGAIRGLTSVLDVYNGTPSNIRAALDVTDVSTAFAPSVMSGATDWSVEIFDMDSHTRSRFASGDFDLYNDVSRIKADGVSDILEAQRFYGGTNGDTLYAQLLYEQRSDGEGWATFSCRTSGGSFVEVLEVKPDQIAAGQEIFANDGLRVTSGNLRVGTHSAIGAETVTGYITIKDSGGTDRKIAVVS
jgi:hypothetical protein